MNRLIVIREIRDVLFSGRFLWSAGLFYALFLIAIIDGLQYFKSENKIRNDASAQSYRQWLEQGEKNPHSAAHYGFYAYKPVSSLAIIDRGLDDFLGNAVWLEAHNQNETKTRAITDKVSLSRFGVMTAGQALYVFFPLLLVIWGFDRVSRERETQTLRLLSSTGTSTMVLLCSKALALLLTGLALVLPALFITAGVVALASPVVAWINFCLLVLFLFILYAFISIAVISVSALSRQSGHALVILMAGWLLGTVIVPRLSGTLARVMAPAPSAFAFQLAIERDKEQGLDGHSPGSERSKKFEREVLDKYGVDSVNQLPLNFAGLSLQAGEEFANLVYDKHFGGLYAVFRNQDRIMSLTALLSPFMAARGTTMSFAGTDLDRHRAFVRQAEDHRRKIQRLMNDDFALNATGKDFSTYLKGKELWGKVMNFNFIAPGTSELLTFQSLNILVLLLWTLLAFILLFISVKHLNRSL